MANDRPFRFGVQVQGAGDRDAWLELARTAEGLGYSTLSMPDHFTGQLAPVPALQAALDATTTLRVGALVHDNDYKHPVVLAKELATMDVLSGGRVDIGLGAGWAVEDYEWSGIAFDPAGVRIDRMIEGLTVIRGCHAPGPFSFEGAHYRINAYDGLPKPRSRMPVVIGGGGRRVLRIAAELADVVGVNATLTAGTIDHSTFSTMTAAAVDEKVQVVRDAATNAGRSDEIELHMRCFVVDVVENTDEADRALEAIAAFVRTTPDVVRESPFVMIGSAARIADDLRERRARWGFSFVTIGQQEIEAFAPVVAELAGT